MCILMIELMINPFKYKMYDLGGFFLSIQNTISNASIEIDLMI